jgi:tetratricopeptide (TPR) repeat protein
MTDKKEVIEESQFMKQGKIYFLNNKFDEAVLEFEKEIKANPSNPEAYYNIGLIYESSNKIELARQMYSKALLIKDDYEIAREKLNKLIGIEK